MRVFVEQEVGRAIHAYVTGRSSTADDKHADEGHGGSGASKEKAVKRPKHRGAADDVTVMRARATANVMFGRVSISATALKASFRVSTHPAILAVICVPLIRQASHGLDKVKFIPEFEGVSVKTPDIEYYNKTLTIGNLISEIASGQSTLHR